MQFLYLLSAHPQVYKALLNDVDVAVKILSTAHRQYYYSERDIFILPHMIHPSIVKFYGAKERPTCSGFEFDGPTQYMIVTAFAPLGTLTNYLKNNTLDWYTLCRMEHSIASGLAHLHTEIATDGRFLFIPCRLASMTWSTLAGGLCNRI